MQPAPPVFSIDYWGEVISDHVGSHSISVYGFENLSAGNRAKTSASIEGKGTFWGFVQSGRAEAKAGGVRWNVETAQWFSLASEGQLQLELVSPGTRIFIVKNEAHHGLPMMGGPIEKTGRLQYIDGCTDTILYPPPLKGDPCLNHLHFPPGVDQTRHFHPSSRCGIVTSGLGLCVADTGTTELTPGQIFYLPKNLRHKFVTGEKNVLNVVSFHPDSDWGPTHEVHPMINRTWMDQKNS